MEKQTAPAVAKLTKAQQILNALKPKASVEINIIEGVSFTFYQDLAAYDQFVNQVSEKNKITPAKDYLLSIVAAEDRDDLLQVINLPNLALQLMKEVNEALIPSIDLKVKKLSDVLSN